MFVHFNHESLNDLLFAFVNPTKRSSFWLILALRTHLDFTQWAKKNLQLFLQGNTISTSMLKSTKVWEMSWRIKKKCFVWLLYQDIWVTKIAIYRLRFKIQKKGYLIFYFTLFHLILFPHCQSLLIIFIDMKTKQKNSGSRLQKIRLYI